MGIRGKTIFPAGFIQERKKKRKLILGPHNCVSGFRLQIGNVTRWQQSSSIKGKINACRGSSLYSDDSKWEQSLNAHKCVFVCSNTALLDILFTVCTLIVVQKAL